MKNEICGKPAPSFWLPKGLVCILPKDHKIETRETPKLKKKVIEKGGGHRTNDNRWWPIGKANEEFL